MNPQLQGAKRLFKRIVDKDPVVSNGEVCLWVLLASQQDPADYPLDEMKAAIYKARSLIEDTDHGTRRVRAFSVVASG